MDAEQRARLAVEDHLEEAAVVAEDLAARDLRIARHADFVRDLLLGELLLGRTHHRDLGDRVDAVGEARGRRLRLEPEHRADSKAALLRARRRERGETDHIARRRDVRHGRLVARVDGEASAFVGLQARLLERETFGRADAAHREEHGVDHEALAALELDRRASDALAAVDLLHGLAEAEGDALLPHLVDQFVDDLRVAELEQALVTVDERDLDAEFGEHRRVFEADHAGADHRDRSRELGQADDVVARQHRAVVGLDGRRRRLAAAGDQDELGGDLPRRGARVDEHGVLVDERRAAAEELDIVAHELPRDDIELALDDLVHAVDEIGHRGPRSLDGGAVLQRRHAGEREHGLAEGLARDGARVQAHAAHHALALDDGDTLADLRRLNGGPLARWPAADHEKVEFKAHREVRKRGRRRGVATPSAVYRTCRDTLAACLLIRLCTALSLSALGTFAEALLRKMCSGRGPSVRASFRGWRSTRRAPTATTRASRRTGVRWPSCARRATRPTAARGSCTRATFAAPRLTTSMCAWTGRMSAMCSRRVRRGIGWCCSGRSTRRATMLIFPTRTTAARMDSTTCWR